MQKKKIKQKQKQNKKLIIFDVLKNAHNKNSSKSLDGKFCTWILRMIMSIFQQIQSLYQLVSISISGEHSVSSTKR